MQNSTFQQNPPSTPVINGDYGIIDTSPTPTIILSDNHIVPPPSLRPGRTLVLCFDGTGDQFDADNSNVVQLFSMLIKDHPDQLVYYQAGIGTYTIPEIATPLAAKISKTVDMMIGKHLDAHVMGGYEFLMQNYKSDDRICIFGFSRGAYTARALAGMIQKIGLIPRCNHQQVPFAYHMYSRDDEKGWKDSTAFKNAFSIDVKIEFVGVWDTVNAVGIIPKTLPFALGNDSIKCFRHALSLDERRVRFKPSTWKRSKQSDDKMLKGRRNKMHKLSRSELEDEFTPKSDKESNAKEVWFAGCHCDIGGGSVENNTRNSLARIPLRWMIREIFDAGVGILFDRKTFKYIGMDPKTLYPCVLERPDMIHYTPSIMNIKAPANDLNSPNRDDPEEVFKDFINEELEDVADAISPAHDELDRAWWWWILECTPQPIFYQDPDHDNEEKVVSRRNMGDGRFVLDRFGLNIHRSVKIRMDAQCVENGKYRPRAKLDLQKAKHEWVA